MAVVELTLPVVGKAAELFMIGDMDELPIVVVFDTGLVEDVADVLSGTDEVVKFDVGVA